MRTPFFMGIDIGTYESKGVLTDADANIIAYKTRPHALETPRAGYAEHDAQETWWGDFCAIAKALIAESGVAPSDIQSVAASAIAPCCLPVDKDMRPLRKAILYGIDCRAAAEIAFLEEKIGKDEILRRFGTPITTQSAGAKVLWIKNNEPEIYAKTHKFVTSTTYLVAKLTGEYAIDRYTAATWVPLYDIEKQDWADDLMGICRRDQLAQCRWTDEPAGYVTKQAALETGLSPGTRVITGTADASAEAFSVGVIAPGDMMLMYGSSIFIIHVVKKFTRDARLWAGPYLFPGTYSVAAGMSCSGTLTRWFRDNFAADISARAAAEGQNAYAEIAKLAQNVPAGSDGLIVLPYFSGERTPINDPHARGMIFGLNLLHTRAHIYRAILEGVGYGINQHFEIFDAREMGTKNVMAVGGGVQNETWLQIVSDISGKEQLLPEITTGAAYGDALLAALGAGEYRSAQDVAARIRRRQKIVPDPAKKAIYAPYCTRYARLYEQTKELMHEM